jgi:hypothetical protein
MKDVSVHSKTSPCLYSSLPIASTLQIPRSKELMTAEKVPMVSFLAPCAGNVTVKMTSLYKLHCLYYAISLIKMEYLSRYAVRMVHQPHRYAQLLDISIVSQ